MRQVPVIAGLAGLVLAILAWPGSAAATGVAPNPKQVSGAFATTSSCGSLSGVGVSWTSTNNAVTSVVLTSIPAACVGAAVSLTLVGTGNGSLASAGPVTITGTAQTLSSLTGSATALSVVGAYVSVVGP
jgi:hypothetical protein